MVAVINDLRERETPPRPGDRPARRGDQRGDSQTLQKLGLDLRVRTYCSRAQRMGFAVLIMAIE